MTSSPVSSLNIFLLSSKLQTYWNRTMLSFLQDSIHEGTSAQSAFSIPLSGNNQFILQNQLSRHFPQGTFLPDPVSPDPFSLICICGPRPCFLPRAALATTHSILTAGKSRFLSQPLTKDFLCTVPTEKERLPAGAQTGLHPQRPWLL